MNLIILISTPDSQGLVHKITANLLEFNIEKNDEFVDKESAHFFMRTEISCESSADIVAIQRKIEANLKAILPPQSFIKVTQKSKKSAVSNENSGFLVRVAGFEPTASWTRTMRATNCATPG